MPPQGDVSSFQDEFMIPRVEIVQEDEQPDYGEDNTWEYSEEFDDGYPLSASSSRMKTHERKLHSASKS